MRLREELAFQRQMQLERGYQNAKEIELKMKRDRDNQLRRQFDNSEATKQKNLESLQNKHDLNERRRLQQ